MALTLFSSACLPVAVGVMFNEIVGLTITPFTLLLHFMLAISLSAWILNLRIRIVPERKSLVAIGTVVAVGSVWSTLQQWFGYVGNGLSSDITLVAGAMLLDASGGCVTYVLFHQNVLRR